MEQTRRQIVDFYNQLYRDGEPGHYPPAVTRRMLLALTRRARLAPASRVLDVGCATGYYSAILADMGHEVTGIDISAAGIIRARAAHPGIDFVLGDATALPFPEQSFDLVFAQGVSVANTRDTEAVRTWLQYLLRFTAPGGVVAFLGGSDLSGGEPVESNWYNHRWEEIMQLVPPSCEVEGPWLTHVRLMQRVPPAFSMNGLTTLLLRLPLLRVQRRIVILLKNTHEKP